MEIFKIQNLLAKGFRWKWTSCIKDINRIMNPVFPIVQ